MTTFCKAKAALYTFTTRIIIASYLLLCSAAELYASGLDDQREVFRSIQPDVEYRLTLSALKTVNATITAEREVLIQAKVQRTTYEFQRELKTSEAWQLLNDALVQPEYREIYSCDGLACGRSNGWANDRFEIKQLYGLDQTQKYRVFAVSDTEIVVIYFVQRGNRRIYSQVDRIFAFDAVDNLAESYTTIVKMIEKDGYYAIVKDQEQISEQQLSQLVRALKIKPITRFYIVGHCYTEGQQEHNVACSEEIASSLKKALVERGVRERRLTIQAVGELTPRSAIPVNRVELVVNRG